MAEGTVAVHRGLDRCSASASAVLVDRVNLAPLDVRRRHPPEVLARVRTPGQVDPLPAPAEDDGVVACARSASQRSGVSRSMLNLTAVPSGADAVLECRRWGPVADLPLRAPAIGRRAPGPPRPRA